MSKQGTVSTFNVFLDKIVTSRLLLHIRLEFQSIIETEDGTKLIVASYQGDTSA